ncbi:hypothetical protein Sjap_000678 [Stephania japonica]|uniref:NADH dehydrogenase [ubiquinone] iron-sulfur protein 4, mitochondrial n=1 Tax=Stephania japonica TaxID=461633 RepID=A0AAP0KK46_9MAGN
MEMWENPLMGWTSTGDPYANVSDSALSFNCGEAAKAFAEKHGWDYAVVKEDTTRLIEESPNSGFKCENYNVHMLSLPIGISWGYFLGGIAEGYTYSDYRFPCSKQLVNCSLHQLVSKQVYPSAMPRESNPVKIMLKELRGYMRRNSTSMGFTEINLYDFDMGICYIAKMRLVANCNKGGAHVL